MKPYYRCNYFWDSGKLNYRMIEDFVKWCVGKIIFIHWFKVCEEFCLFLQISLAWRMGQATWPELLVWTQSYIPSAFDFCFLSPATSTIHLTVAFWFFNDFYLESLLWVCRQLSCFLFFCFFFINNGAKAQQEQNLHSHYSRMSNTWQISKETKALSAS